MLKLRKRYIFIRERWNNLLINFEHYCTLKQKISSKITETDNHNVSKNIAVCQKSLQKQSLEKLIERSSNKQKLVRCMAIVSKEIHHIMLNIELKKEKQPSCFPTQPIRT